MYEHIKSQLWACEASNLEEQEQLSAPWPISQETSQVSLRAWIAFGAHTVHPESVYVHVSQTHTRTQLDGCFSIFFLFGCVFSNLIEAFCLPRFTIFCFSDLVKVVPLLEHYTL